MINPAWNSSDAVASSVPELNKAAFVYPANMVYGNTPIRIAQLRGPKTINEDISLLKNLRVTEKKYFEFRLSAFNALNRHIFPGPDTNMASATFGYITSPQGNSTAERSVRFEVLLLTQCRCGVPVGAASANCV